MVFSSSSNSSTRLYAFLIADDILRVLDDVVGAGKVKAMSGPRPNVKILDTRRPHIGRGDRGCVRLWSTMAFADAERCSAFDHAIWCRRAHQEGPGILCDVTTVMIN